MKNETRLETLKRRHAEEMARAESEIRFADKMNELGLWLDYLDPLIYDHRSYLSYTVRMPDSAQVAGVFSFFQKIADPNIGEFLCPEVGLKQVDDKAVNRLFRKGNWDFDWGLYKHRRSDSYEYMPVFPIIFETTQREVEQNNFQGGNYFVPTTASIIFLAKVAGYTIKFDFEWKTWSILREFGLGWAGSEGGNLTRTNHKRIYPVMNSWDHIYYQGGTDLHFIPMPWVWANGTGWEEDLIGRKLERE